MNLNMYKHVGISVDIVKQIIKCTVVCYHAKWTTTNQI